MIGIEAASPYGITACPGVRPGALVRTPKGQCTLNFLYQGSDGARYIGTAGHCILGTQLTTGENVGERTWAAGTGPVATDSKGNFIGRFVYAALQEPRDYALIRLESWVAANPQMCHFGGPTGPNSDIDDNWRYIQHYGNGIGYGTASPGRTDATLWGMPNAYYVMADGGASSGDSGAPVSSYPDNRAIGVLVATGAFLGNSQAGSILVTRLMTQVPRASAVLGVGLSLMTAPPR